MSGPIDIAVTTFSANLQMNLQQTSSTLRGTVAEGNHVGRNASPVQYIKPFKVKTPQGRYSQIVHTESEFERRWVFPKDGDLAALIDTFDQLRLISDPKSQYAPNFSAAIGREWDDRIIASATADAKLGRDIDAFSTETFDTTTYGVADTYGAGAVSVGLTVAKLIELQRKLSHYSDGTVDDEQLTIVAGSQQRADLLGQQEVVSTEYNERPVLQDGKVKRMLGFDIRYVERLPVQTANIRTCLAYMKSGLYLGIWSDFQTSADQRVDITGKPWQLYTKMTSGGTRLEKGRFFAVYCADTTGVSIVP